MSGQKNVSTPYSGNDGLGKRLLCNLKQCGWPLGKSLKAFWVEWGMTICTSVRFESCETSAWTSFVLEVCEVNIQFWIRLTDSPLATPTEILGTSKGGDIS